MQLSNEMFEVTILHHMVRVYDVLATTQPLQNVLPKPPQEVWIGKAKLCSWKFLQRKGFAQQDSFKHKIKHFCPQQNMHTLFFSISFALRFITSLVSLILLSIMSLCSFSSWLSISTYCLTWAIVTFSLCPEEITSSNENMISKAILQIPSSSSEGTYSGT